MITKVIFRKFRCFIQTLSVFFFYHTKKLLLIHLVFIYLYYIYKCTGESSPNINLYSEVRHVFILISPTELARRVTIFSCGTFTTVVPLIDIIRWPTRTPPRSAIPPRIKLHICIMFGKGKIVNYPDDYLRVKINLKFIIEFYLQLRFEH